jgi:nucleotide-binding universal stress UspA family protein
MLAVKRVMGGYRDADARDTLARMVRSDNGAGVASKPFLRRLLVATDGSDAGNRAVSFAIALARTHGSELEFCDAVDRTGAMLACCTPEGQSASMIPLLDVLDDTAHSIVAKARRQATDAGLTATADVVHGTSVAAIVRCENDHRFDAVVIGTEAKTGLERLFTGSTASGVSRRSEIPVFVIPPGASAPPRGIARILVAEDESGPSDAAVTFAIDFAASEGAHLTACAVAETTQLVDNAAYYAFDPSVTLRELHDAADSLVTDACARARSRNVPCERIVVEGNIADRILAAAEQRRADIVVVGTHGRRGIRRWMLGSVAETVARRSSVPVVIVHASHEHDEAD